MPNNIESAPAYVHLREALQTLAGLETADTGTERREGCAAIRRRVAAALEQLEALEPDPRTYPVDGSCGPMRRRMALQTQAPEEPGRPVRPLRCPACMANVFAVNDDGHVRCVECHARALVRMWVEPVSAGSDV